MGKFESTVHSGCSAQNYAGGQRGKKQATSNLSSAQTPETIPKEIRYS